MATKYRFVFLGLIVLLTMVGCSGGIGRAVTVEPVDAVTLVRELQFTDGQEEGPMYLVSVTVPDSWIGRFETSIQGNRIAFEFQVDEERRASIFYIDALSRSQYWEQIGSYPGPYQNIVFTSDTYFIYSVPIYAYYSGLPDDEFQAFADAVPQIVSTFDAVRVG
jgi:hypothetical protein